MIIEVFAAVFIVALLTGLLYWLLVITEGVYLGRRIVVWLYDITAHKYDRVKEFDDEAERVFVAQPLRFHLREKAAPLVLDVATGTGRLPHYLLQEPISSVCEKPFRCRCLLGVAGVLPFGCGSNAGNGARAATGRHPYGHTPTWLGSQSFPGTISHEGAVRNIAYDAWLNRRQHPALANRL
jgi:hypothetical protein